MNQNRVSSVDIVKDISKEAIHARSERKTVRYSVTSRLGI